MDEASGLRMKSEQGGEHPGLLASLPWYDVAATHASMDDFWSVLRRELEKAGIHELPRDLDRMTPLRDQWQQPGLVVSQCCGLDLFTPAAGSLLPIARPVFSDIAGQPGSYFSHIVAAGTLGQQPRRAVVNAASSRSGCAALLEWASERGWLDLDVLISGSHEASLRYLKEDLADFAAIDAHSWNLLDTKGMSIIGRSSDAPAPPFVTHRACSVSAALTLRALTRAVEEAGESIGIRQVMPASVDDYQGLSQQRASLARYRSRAG